MSSTINVNGTTYQLPKFTLALAERNQTVGNTTEIREKAEKMFSFLCDVLGKSAVYEIVDGEDYESADLAAMTNLFVKVNTAYANDMQSESNRNLQNDIEEAQRMTSAIDGIVKSADKAKALAENKSKIGLQAFASAAN